MWDTSGQLLYRPLIPSYIIYANCTMIIFDVFSKDSFENIKVWEKLSYSNTKKDSFTFLVGNKIGLNYREVTEVEARQLAKKMGMLYFEVSAKTGQNI
jgi:GTPase SAR1 family protein